MSRRSSVASLSSGGGSRPRSAVNENKSRRSSVFGNPSNPQGVVVVAKEASDVCQLKSGDAFYKTVRRFPSVPGLADDVSVTAATSISSAFAFVAAGSLAKTRRSISDHRPSIGAIAEDVSLDSPYTALYR